MKTKTFDGIAASIIGLITGAVCYYFRTWLAPGAGDFNWALKIARDLLAGRDPYNFTSTALAVPYPLPVAVFGLPLVGVPDIPAAAIFFGLCSALLAYGVLRYDLPARLLLFLSLPFIYAAAFAQWSPLAAAAWFFPALAPLMMLVKPQLALPVALTKHSRAGVIAAVVVLAASLAIYPTWPLKWLSMTQGYVHRVPIAVLPFGPLLLLSFIKWRDERALLLGLMSLMPYRGVYDLTALALVPSTPWGIVAFVGLSWIMPLIDMKSALYVGVEWPVALLFLPMMAVRFWELRKPAPRLTKRVSVLPSSAGAP